MRRGGLLILVLILLVLVLAGVGYVVWSGMLDGGGVGATPAPALSGIVVVKQPIARDALITADALDIMPYPEDRITESMYRSIDQVREIYYAKFPLAQGLPLTKDMLSERPGMLQEGSDVAKTIPLSMTAITVPITRLGSVGYAIKDGDRVNVIATTRFVDVDASFQTILPNSTGPVYGTGYLQGQLPRLTVLADQKLPPAIHGRAELDPALNEAIYVYAAELQRPRLVAQMILQDIQVLHIGDFSQAAAAQQQDPNAPADQQEAPPPVTADIITLIVNPQDAISLTYMVYSGAKLTLTLRPPDDPDRREMEAVTLQYLLSQYNIPVPAKLPYSLSPRVDDPRINPEPPLATPMIVPYFTPQP